MAEVKALQINVDKSRCVGCGSCVRLCPRGVFDFIGGKAMLSHPERCVECNLCMQNCPAWAISIGKPIPVVTPRETTTAPPTTPATPPRETVIASPAMPITGPITGPTSPPTLLYIPNLRPVPEAAKVKEPPRVLVEAAVQVRNLEALSGICCGCRSCELVCSLTHTGVVNPYLSRIRVSRNMKEGSMEPVICHHCDPAPCEMACPVRALYRSPHLSKVVLVDEKRCIKCYQCVYKCPFGAIQIRPDGGILKCDLCGGNPACVQLCQERPEVKPSNWTGGKVSCLQFLEAHEATLLKRALASSVEKRGESILPPVSL